MNQVQTRYVVAKAALDTVREELARRRPAFPSEDTDEAIAAYTEECIKLETELGYVATLDHLHAAERELLEWGRGVGLRAAKGVGSATNQADIAELFDEAAQFPNIHEKLVDLMMRVHA